MRKNDHSKNCVKPLTSSSKIQNSINVERRTKTYQTIKNKVDEKSKNIVPSNAMKNSDVFKKVSPHLFRIILEYSIDSIKSYAQISRINRYFYSIINDEGFKVIWINILRKLMSKTFKQENYENLNAIELKNILAEKEKQEILKKFDFFATQIQKAFSLLANKMRVPEKIINCLDLVASIEIFLNKKSKFKLNKKKLNFRNENFGSYLILNIDEISKIPLNQSDDVLEFQIILQSIFLRKQILFSKYLDLNVMKTKCIQTKVFNIYGEENCLLYFFDGDNKILKAVFNISAASIIDNFDVILKKDRMISSNNPKIIKKQINETSIYHKFEYFFKNESDFEFSLNINNNKDTLFNFIDTKLYPNQIEKESVCFLINCKENIKSKFELLISDNLGISERIENFVFVNFTLKSQHKFLIISSNFSRTIAIENSNDFSHGAEFEKQIILIENDKKTYAIQIDLFQHHQEKTKIVENILIIIKKEYFINF
jgi:hypothetical protein